MTHFIVVPVRNGIAFTKAALPTFFAQDIGDICVIAIDNASTDGSTEYLRSQSGVIAWHQDPPLSVAASWNKALRLLFDRLKHGYVLVVNNDIELRPDTYKRLVEDGGLFVTCVGHSEKKSIDSPYRAPDPSKKRPHPDFSCFLIRRECWDRVGPFDENFLGAYAEDADYHIRMHRAGIKAECLELPFYHAASGTIKSVSGKEREQISKRADANRAYFKKKWGVEVGSREYYKMFSPTAVEAEA